MRKEGINNQPAILNRVITLSGMSALCIGLLALAGWISGAGNLTSFFPQYIPMATATAILTSLFGLAFLSARYIVKAGLYRKFAISVAVICTTYAFLKFAGYFLKTELTLDRFLFNPGRNLGRYPINTISPITGFLFFLGGIALILKFTGKEKLRLLNLISTLGIFILFSGFTGVVGYLYKTPFFYGGDIIPVSFPTTIVFALLGCGLVAMGGSESLALKHFFGESSSARILRVIIPIIFIALLADDLLGIIFSQISSVNHVLLSALVALFIIPVTAWTTFKISRNIFKKAEQADELRKKAEASLRESEKRYRLVFENQGEGIGLVDRDECFVFANPAAERIFGVAPGGLTGHNLEEFLPHQEMVKVLEETKKRANDERSSYEIKINSADESLKSLLVTATPQVGDDGNFTGTFGVFRDITAWKKTEAELERSTRALQQSNATKDKFFSIIAHDLKNPFNSILGLTNVLIDDYRTFSEAEIERILTTIKRSSEKAFELLENLLLWANSQTGQISFNGQLFDLAKTTDETLALLGVQAARKNIRMTMANTEPCIVYGDVQMIITVLRNLISNAIKFTPQGGEVTVSMVDMDSSCKISVRDTGRGIAPDNLEKLFRIDTKYSTVGTSNERGTGLGLILCKEFVEKNGGIIGVESEEGKGSTFHFTVSTVRIEEP